MLNEITPLILTYNEEPNIARTLAKLSWAREIVVVDSASTDRTCELAAARPGVRVVQHAFTSHAEKWRFGLEHCGITSEWVLALDADYVLSDALVAELGALSPPPDVAGYRASFQYCIGGRPLHGAAYPPVTVLYRRTRAGYIQDGHTQRVQVDGGVRPLAAPIFHDDRKPLAHWLAQQARNMKLEVEKLAQAPPDGLALVDRLRKLIVITPVAVPLYCLFLRGGILDGWPGLYYAFQRGTAEAILSMYLMERLFAREDARS
jgi:glycosyltransferase involved in cell wall biosynthesis